MKFTVEQFASLNGLEKPVAYGVLRFLGDKGMVETSKAVKTPGTRGKPAIIYSFNDETASKFASFVTALPTPAEPVVEVAQTTEAPAEQPQA